MDNEIELREYIEGIYEGESSILCNGLPMTTEAIIERLRSHENTRTHLQDTPEINIDNYTHEEVDELNDSLYQAYEYINAS